MLKKIYYAFSCFIAFIILSMTFYAIYQNINTEGAINLSKGILIISIISITAILLNKFYLKIMKFLLKSSVNIIYFMIFAIILVAAVYIFLHNAWLIFLAFACVACIKYIFKD